MSNRQHFIAFNFQCDTPKVEWFQHLEIPAFRTVEVIGLQVKEVDGIIYLNDDGQVINLARSTGTDKQNEKGIRDSFLKEGINTSFLPPVCLDTGELIDGFTRHSVLVGFGTPSYVYLVVKLKDGFTIDDAIDEIGLGRNLHPQAKKSTMPDYKKRLTRFVVRTESSTDEKFTINQGIQWFNGIPNNFSDEEIENAVEDVLKKIRSLENMESFTKAEAEKRTAKLLNKERDGILAFNTSSSTYIDRGIVEIINHFDEHGTVPTAVGFLSKVEADDADVERKKVLKKINSINRVFVRLMNEYKKDADFNLINFEGFLPQVLGKESEIIKP
tara:strand:- start:93 stop:1079 length:987 start_codon:yes stop_codon:yes gene_type:complete